MARDTGGSSMPIAGLRAVSVMAMIITPTSEAGRTRAS